MQLNKPLRAFTFRNWLFVFLQSLVLLLIFLFYNNRNYVFSGEEQLLTKIDVVNEMILKRDYKTPYNFVFINTGKDLELAKDNEGSDIVITDRQKLAAFFQILADSDAHTYILADILFDLPSANDSTLAAVLPKLKRTVFPKHLSDTGEISSVFGLHSAIADYNTNVKKFSKFKLMYPTGQRTLPVAMHEDLQQVKYTSHFGGIFCNGKYCLQSIPPRYYIRPYQLETKAAPFYNLGELLTLTYDSSFYAQFLKNKFIVLGNFDTDIHSTPIGKMPGVLILLNTYLSLRDGRHMPGVSWFVTLFGIFFLINLYLFYGKVKVPKIPDKEKWWHVLIREKLNNQLANIFSVIGLCLFISLISEITFNIKPHTFVIFIYIILFSELLKYYRIWKEGRK